MTMSMSKKTMRREDWRRILKRAYAFADFECGELSGAVGLIRTDRVSEPFCRTMFGRNFTLVDDGYYWLQVAPRNQKWWLTVMYDDQLRLLQYYFDITDGNVVRSSGDSYFVDLYLDVVHVPGEGSVLLDADELDEALAGGVINAAQHAMAHREARRILEGLQAEEARLEAFCMAQTLRLKRLMETDANFNG